jgi:hypothetical protein
MNSPLLAILLAALFSPMFAIAKDCGLKTGELYGFSGDYVLKKSLNNDRQCKQFKSIKIKTSCDRFVVETTKVDGSVIEREYLREVSTLRKPNTELKIEHRADAGIQRLYYEYSELDTKTDSLVEHTVRDWRQYDRKGKRAAYVLFKTKTVRNQKTIGNLYYSCRFSEKKKRKSLKRKRRLAKAEL